MRPVAFRAMSLWAVALGSCLALAGCDYVVIPEQAPTPPPAVAGGGWAALATNVEQTPDGLHVDLAIRNDTGDWSAMALDDTRSVRLSDGSGGTSSCATAVVGTGGTSIPAGFIIRGFTGGTKAEPEIQKLQADCAGATPGAGSTLSIPYTYTTGDFNYYRPAPAQSDTTVVDLDAVITDVTYPVAAASDLVVSKVGEPIEAINKVALTLTAFDRTDDTIEFTWHTDNPTSYPAFVHIGIPPVLGSDGIIYGRYESPHLADTPITPANESAEWTTTVTVPADITGLYVLPAVESKQQKNFTSHAIELGDS
jgi:hypothetical protein